LIGITGFVNAAEDIYNLVSGNAQSNTWANTVVDKLVPEGTTVSKILRPTSISLNLVEGVRSVGKAIGGLFGRWF